MSAPTPKKQLLHLVIGGELSKLDATEFKDLDKVELVGVYPNYGECLCRLAGQAQQTSTMRRCAISLFTLHRLLDPRPRPARARRADRTLSYAVVAADHQSYRVQRQLVSALRITCVLSGRRRD